MSTNAPTIQDLAAALVEAKAAEDAAKARRVEIEKDILLHPDIASAGRDEGTVTVGPIKVTFRLSRKWDQDELFALHQTIDPAFWPFKAEWKEDRQAMRVLEERFPDLARELGIALTVAPAKPSIAVK